MDSSDQQDVSAWLDSDPWQSSSPPHQGTRGNAAVSDKHTAEPSVDKPDDLQGGNAMLAQPSKGATVAEPATEAAQKKSHGMLSEVSKKSQKEAKRGLATASPTAAGRRQHNVRSASPALSLSVKARPDADADQRRNKQADQEAPTARAEDHQHMSASSALLSQPNQALPTEAAIPVTASAGTLESGGQPLPGTAGTAGGAEQGLGLSGVWGVGPSQPGQRRGQTHEETMLMQQSGTEGIAQSLSHGYRYIELSC